MKQNYGYGVREDKDILTKVYMSKMMYASMININLDDEHSILT